MGAIVLEQPTDNDKLPFRPLVQTILHNDHHLSANPQITVDFPTFEPSLDDDPSTDKREDDTGYSSDPESEDEELTDITRNIPPASDLDERWMPSPTNVTDFPMANSCYFKLNEDITLQPRTTTRFPTIVDATTRLVAKIASTHIDPQHPFEEQELITEVLGSTVVADVGTFGHTRILHTMFDPKGKMADSGANCSMTNNKHLLEDLTPLDQPMNIGVALTEKDAEFSYAVCTHADCVAKFHMHQIQLYHRRPL
jgi:hypothetical protein